MEMVPKVVVFVLIAGFCFMANAVIYQEELQAIPEHLKEFAGDDKGCFFRDLDVVIPFNTIIYIKECVKAECTPDAIEYTMCDVPKLTDPRCKIIPTKEDESKYPVCCPKIQCE